MRKQIGKAINGLVKKLGKIGTAIIVTLLLANVVYAAVPVSDGFDYPVGWPDRRQVINIDSCLMVIMTRIFRNNHR